MTDKAWTTLVHGRAEDDGTYEVDNILRKGLADYLVVTNPIFVYDRFQMAYVQIPNRFATGREVSDGDTCRLDSWEVVKDRYEVEQSQKILSRAISLVNKYGDAAKLMGCGVLDEGRKFFAVVHTGSLSIKLANGQTDVVDSYVVVMSSHDGSIPICYYNLDSRRSTHSVYRFSASKECEFSIRKRHTPSEADLDGEAKEVLNMRAAWSQHVVGTISSMSVPISEAYITTTLETMWPLQTANTEKKREHIESVHSRVKTLYLAPHNSGAYGPSKWALFNAMTEYIDFHRNIPDREAAQHALEIDNFSHRLKLEVHKCMSL
tara:strand:- start:261 stop:1220 length:960 start_codon:yes stop_codon:yes gene_type:complete